MPSATILVVEDEEDIIELLQFNLVKAGYDARAATSGEDAVRFVRLEPPDLIVLDLMLPGIDGLEVCRLLKADANTRHIPIVMLTAKGEEADIIVGLELGADDYITKPFSPKVLIARLRAVLRRRARSEPDETVAVRIHNLVIHPGRHRLPVIGAQEVSALANTLNQMAAQLDERIATIVCQRNEQEAVLSSMIEGVFAVDPEGQIITLNKAAAHLLGVEPTGSAGRRLQELVHNAPLLEFIDDIAATQTPGEGEIRLLLQDEERRVRVLGTPLRGPGQNSMGVVIVLNDVTRLHKLETIRRDFVANVSHELRTPITSIKGFVETLLDGKLQESPDSRRFLEIVESQADRLNAIIEDLLSLSRLEEEERSKVALEEGDVAAVVAAAVQACCVKASAKDVALENTCRQSVTARINAHLLEQAIVNLIDNAVKYSEPNSSVRLSVEENEDAVVVRVEDHGCGIANEHVPRIFERFYRVDKARSRRLGGTGLGLAIVKHIAQIHNGRATVESHLGTGSTFSLHIPKD
ncbi:MAG TPA: response regulator [Candidatus Hydrogenedentes bacterium]|nr:response regulator [Candidatus Hydrogenedentota bacterium]